MKAGAVLIEAVASNIANIYFGDSAANIAAGNCYTLAPGDSVSMSLDDSAADEDRIFLDLQDLWFDGVNTGDKLIVNYLVEEYVEY